MLEAIKTIKTIWENRNNCECYYCGDVGVHWVIEGDKEGYLSCDECHEPIY